MKLRYLKICIIVALNFPAIIVFSQTLPVGTPVLEDYYRRLQITGKFDSTASFTTRPLFSEAIGKNKNIFDPEGTLKNEGWTSTPALNFARNLGLFQILPVTIQQQFNSDHPYGWNDGLMIPAKGYQTMLSAGIFVKFGLLSIQLRPEFVYASNPIFNGFASLGRNNGDLQNYYTYHNLIDQPERIGSNNYHKASFGQSSIRLTLGAISAGLSSENLWWGPGIRNSLIMSNNAAGFNHVTLNTVKPVHTIIGSFEGQAIGGLLNATGQPSLAITNDPAGDYLPVSKPQGARYWTGINLSYQPKWLPGLFLGFTRTFNAYRSDVKKLKDYVPFLLAFQKSSLNNGTGDEIPRDQQTSFYARWVLPKAKAEIYFEYGLNDNSYNYHDFLADPQHSRAYIFGFRKILTTNSIKNEGIMFSGEITQLSQSPDYLIRSASGWYIHYQVTDGQTNEGQILGAGTGSGGNLQSMDVSWVMGVKKVGLTFERYEHDVDYAIGYGHFLPVSGHSRNWVDFAFGIGGDWNYKNLLFNAKIQAIKSLNYEWVLKDYNPVNSYYIPHNDIFNLHTEVGVTYRF